ncbi:serine protease snake-like [Homalodisca vitripennis]|uniref:serine protease snake-like n=1 Tax=Homalodisca vitripennis TaxID=197043 RepID=UPI001EEBAD38|nr:serine protease snake-like [Homalodisca vitripennis]
MLLKGARNGSVYTNVPPLVEDLERWVFTWIQRVKKIRRIINVHTVTKARSQVLTSATAVSGRHLTTRRATKYRRWKEKQIIEENSTPPPDGQENDPLDLAAYPAAAASTSATFSVNMRSTAVAVWTTLWTVCYAYGLDFPTDKHLEENDVCRDDGDKAWRCRKARECDALSELTRNGKVVTCSLANRHNPLVCCPPLTSNHVNQTISQQKCEEYKEAVCHQTLQPNKRLPGGPPDTVLESTSPVTNDTEEVPDMLTEAVEDSLRFLVVYGGENAWAGEHPHMASVGFGPEIRILWRCGGSLISKRFVMSAAHCSEPEGLGKARWVLLGAIDIRYKDGPMRQQFQIVEHHVHKDYRSHLLYNDIVLFRLDRDVQFTRFVAPACLYQGLTEPEGRAVVTGWGRNHSAGPTMPVLQKATLSFLPPEICKERVGVDTEYPEGIHSPSQFCAWEYGKDTCKADSGGPLVRAEKDSCLAEQVGITSFGPVRCGESEIPGTYVRVAYFLPWIESIVWPSP